LQQWPSPWGDRSHAQTGGTSEADFIEFGSLDDEPAATVHAAATFDETYFEPAGQVGPAAEATLLIHQIDDHLDELEREYVASPAQAIASAATWPGDPFAEDFDEEEVLIDRYTSLQPLMTGGLKQVESDDGRAIAALLEPFDHFESPTLAVVGAPGPAEPESLVASAATGPEVLQATNPLAPFSASTLDVASSAAFLQNVSADDEPLAAEWVGETPVSLEEADEPSSDEDLMIVEEDPRHEIRPHSPMRPAQVRRQEYRQLFSSLRRG
jgi:hypothetical protein